MTGFSALGCFFGVFFGADPCNGDFCDGATLGRGPSLSSVATLGAIGFKGPKGFGAVYFLGPFGPRFNGLPGLLTVFPLLADVSTNCAIEGT